MKKWNSEICSEIKKFFHHWDCSRINNSQLLESIEALGVYVPNELREALGHHSLTRNLSYIEFMRILMRGDTADGTRQANRGEYQYSARSMDSVIFKSNPVASSEKAPYGTDNNRFLNRERNTKNPSFESAETELDHNRKALRSVPGSKDVFRESEREESVVLRESLPDHLRSSFEAYNSATVSPATTPRDISSHVLVSRNVITGSGVTTNHESSTNIQKSKRHFEDKSTLNFSAWSANEPSNPGHQHQSRKQFSTDVISHCSDRPPLPYRPIMKSGSARKPEYCPFATDSDDLEKMRASILLHRLGKQAAPAPFAKTHDEVHYSN